MKCVDNGVVKKAWDIDGWVENAYYGFIGAVNDYHGVAVAFDENVAYAMIDDEGSLSLKDVANLIKKSYKIKKGANPTVTKEYDMDEYEEYTILVDEGEPLEDNCKLAGLTDADIKDILERIEDLAPYYKEVIVDM